MQRRYKFWQLYAILHASIFHLRLRPSPPCLLLNVLVKVGTSIRDLITTSTALLMHAIVRGFTIHIG